MKGLMAGFLAIALLGIGMVDAAPPGYGQAYYEGMAVDVLVPFQGAAAGNTVEYMGVGSGNAYDPIYMIPGQLAVIGSVPGDSSYSGGRWHGYMVELDDAVIGPVTSVGQLMMYASMGLATISDANAFFLCPVLP